MALLRGNIIFKANHPDGDILVVEHLGKRFLYLGSDAIQSAMDLHSPNQLQLTYTQSMMAFLLFSQLPEHCLLIGLGGGSLAKALHKQFPHTKIETSQGKSVLSRALEH